MGRYLKLFFFAMGCMVATIAVVTGPGSAKSTASATKNLEDYWTETGLKASDLEEILDDDSCRSSERYFLACANSLLAVTTRLGLQLDVAGNLSKGRALDLAASEKTMLEPWRRFFNEHHEEALRLSFEKIWERLRREELKSRHEAALTAAAFNGFLSVFRDPHTYILPIDYYQDVMARANPVSTHLGIVLAKSPENYYLRKVLDQSPASRAGLHKGDWVLTINGISLREMTPQKLNELLRGPAGETVHFLIRRQGALQAIQVRREMAEIPTVTSRVQPGLRRVGVISVHKFGKGTCSKVKESVLALKEQSVRGILLDLRDNQGGVMEEAACMTSLFVGEDLPAFKIRYLDPSKNAEVYYGSEKAVYDGKMAVLINAGSASASEIVAGSLRDHGRALLVGERSFGKGSFQEPETWARNRRVAIFQTKGFYYLPKGLSPQLVGLQPDVPVQFRQTETVREEDQYLHPLHAPANRSATAASVAPLGDCHDIEEETHDDPQMNQARRSLFCAWGERHAQN